jgi:hypothetical protein
VVLVVVMVQDPLEVVVEVQVGDHNHQLFGGDRIYHRVLAVPPGLQTKEQVVEEIPMVAAAVAAVIEEPKDLEQDQKEVDVEEL